MTAMAETVHVRKREAIVHKRYVRVLEGGRTRKPTENEMDLPNDYSRMFMGCWFFSIQRGKKQWCQSGGIAMHKGVKHNV